MCWHQPRTVTATITPIEVMQAICRKNSANLALAAAVPGGNAM
jgi:hypothetical protein